MKKLHALLFVTILTLTFNPKVQAANDYRHEFKTIENDPSNTLIYTLENGLEVYLSVNKLEPRIQTLIAVKAGSKFDPSETTGLAHYLEHMMFKGTHKIGTKNWPAEKLILDEIAATFEAHRLEADPDKKIALYAKIDSLSSEASKFAIANEYDKMVSGIGAKGTNAYTSNDETVYMNDIPSNEIEKWLMLEGERFQTLVLRLFHTELETVYEEFNRSQDSDNRWVYQAVMEGLLPNHPYGTQTTIGVGEHLKNPSMYNIHNYFNKYYVPNNVAICLSGDLDPDATIDMIEKYFGSWKSKTIEPFKQPAKTIVEKPIVKETFGPQQEMVYLGYKFDGAGTKETRMVKMVDMILANSQAGLIDIDLMLQQKVLNASSFPYVLKDYTIHFLSGVPKENQQLEEVKDLLLEEIEKVKQGDFDDWLIDAVINDLKLREIKSLESNRGRAFTMVDAFINDLDYSDVIFELDSLDAITKEEIIAFANDHYNDNYVVSYKRIGESDRHSVPKPQITAVEVDRDSQSSFYATFDKKPSLKLTPKFVDFDKEIDFDNIKDVDFAYVPNKNNKIFNLYYQFEIGSDTDQELALAIQLLPYLGTDKYSSADLKKEFYKLGLTFGVSMGAEKASIYLTGLEENLEKGIVLFEEVLANINASQEVYTELVSDIEKARLNAKLDKGTILRTGLGSYAKYGPTNPFTERLSSEDLNGMNIQVLENKIKALSAYEHTIFYYGNMPQKTVKKIISKYHKNTKKLQATPAKVEFTELATTENKVYFTPYDMQQTEILMLSKDETYNPELLVGSILFNEYFGSGLSSIIFQEIREKKALAYSAYSYYSSPSEKDKSHYVYAYIGTQADKLEDATSAMFELMNNMPEANMQFNAAKEAVIKKLESDWTTGMSVYWKYLSAQKLGINYDIKEQIYNDVQDMTMQDLKNFFDQHIKGKAYSICVIGNKENMDMETLEKLGKVEELSLEEIFGY